MTHMPLHSATFKAAQVDSKHVFKQVLSTLDMFWACLIHVFVLTQAGQAGRPNAFCSLQCLQCQDTNAWHCKAWWYRSEDLNCLAMSSPGAVSAELSGPA